MAILHGYVKLPDGTQRSESTMEQQRIDEFPASHIFAGNGDLVRCFQMMAGRRRGWDDGARGNRGDPSLAKLMGYTVMAMAMSYNVGIALINNPPNHHKWVL